MDSLSEASMQSSLLYCCWGLCTLNLCTAVWCGELQWQILVSWCLGCCSQGFTDLASLGQLPKYTCGQLYYYPAYSHERDAAKLRHELSHNLTRTTGLSDRQPYHSLLTTLQHVELRQHKGVFYAMPIKTSLCMFDRGNLRSPFVPKSSSSWKLKIPQVAMFKFLSWPHLPCQDPLLIV